jgi:catalase
VPRFIQVPQIDRFHKADPAYGSRVAEGLDIKMEEVIGSNKCNK